MCFRHRWVTASQEVQMRGRIIVGLKDGKLSPTQGHCTEGVPTDGGGVGAHRLQHCIPKVKVMPQEGSTLNDWACFWGETPTTTANMCRTQSHPALILQDLVAARHPGTFHLVWLAGDPLISWGERTQRGRGQEHRRERVKVTSAKGNSARRDSRGKRWIKRLPRQWSRMIQNEDDDVPLTLWKRK